MNASPSALKQCPPASPAGDPCPSTPTESSGANPNRAALLGRGDRPASDSPTDFRVTRTVELATMRAETDLTNRFQALCTNDDGATLASILSGMSEEEVSTWLNTALPYSERHDTPMMYVARHNCVSMTAVLMSHKADPVTINPHSTSESHPLYIAAQENNVDVLRVMSTADTFAADTPRGDGSTALFAAVGNQSLEATKFLLEYKADPNFKVLSIALNGEVRPIKRCTEDEATRGIKCWDTLMNVAAEQEQTPDSVKILELLLSKGGKVENIDPDNPLQRSPLTEAILNAFANERSCEKIVDLLLSHGADMYEPLPTPPDLVSPAQNSQSALLGAVKLKVRPSICEHVCMMSLNSVAFPVVQIIHKYYLLQQGSEKMPLEGFVRVNAPEGFCRAVAAYGFPKEVTASPASAQPGQPNRTRTMAALQDQLAAKLLLMDALGIPVQENSGIGSAQPSQPNRTVESLLMDVLGIPVQESSGIGRGVSGD